jgi:hypothetical protein
MDFKVQLVSAATENIPLSSHMELLQKAGEEVQRAADEQNKAAFDEAWAKYEKLLKQFGFKK